MLRDQGFDGNLLACTSFKFREKRKCIHIEYTFRKQIIPNNPKLTKYYVNLVQINTNYDCVRLKKPIFFNFLLLKHLFSFKPNIFFSLQQIIKSVDIGDRFDPVQLTLRFRHFKMYITYNIHYIFLGFLTNLAHIELWKYYLISFLCCIFFIQHRYNN